MSAKESIGATSTHPGTLAKGVCTAYASGVWPQLMIRALGGIGNQVVLGKQIGRSLAVVPECLLSTFMCPLNIHIGHLRTFPFSLWTTEKNEKVSKGGQCMCISEVPGSTSESHIG